MNPIGLLNELRHIVGEPNVLLDDDLTLQYRIDWTGRFRAASATVVRPSCLEEIVAIVLACRRTGTAALPQGGNTGLVGGSVPLSGEIVISTERLNRIEYIDSDVGEAVVEAGVTLGHFRDEIGKVGWDYAVDIASRGSASVGGTVATNAGGLRVVRYGDTRRQVLGVEMVSGVGDPVTRLRRTKRDNSGYHLPSLVTGSEGTLGVLTRVRLRLIPQQQNRIAALLRIRNIALAVRAAETSVRVLQDLESAELFIGEGLELVCRVFGLPMPFKEVDGAYLLLEMASDHDGMVERFAREVERLDGVLDVAVAETDSARSRLWRYREMHPEAIATLGIPHKFDVALPPGALEYFVGGVRAVVGRVDPTASCWLFGHAGESSIHVNVVGPSPDDYRIDAAVFNLVASMDGSISAEHGIGRAKLPWVGLTRSSDEFRLLASLKNAFDPDRILNPNSLLIN